MPRKLSGLRPTLCSLPCLPRHESSRIEGGVTRQGRLPTGDGLTLSKVLASRGMAFSNHAQQLHHRGKRTHFILQSFGGASWLRHALRAARTVRYRGQILCAVQRILLSFCQQYYTCHFPYTYSSFTFIHCTKHRAIPVLSFGLYWIPSADVTASRNEEPCRSSSDPSFNYTLSARHR